VSTCRLVIFSFGGVASSGLPPSTPSTATQGTAHRPPATTTTLYPNAYYVGSSGYTHSSSTPGSTGPAQPLLRDSQRPCSSTRPSPYQQLPLAKSTDNSSHLPPSPKWDPYMRPPTPPPSGSIQSQVAPSSFPSDNGPWIAASLLSSTLYHFPRHGLLGLQPPKQSPQERTFKCADCPQSFFRNHDLKRHTKIHLAVKPFPCSNCDKTFSREDALKVCAESTLALPVIADPVSRGTGL